MREETTFTDRVDRLRQESNELKRAQPVGQDSILSYLTKSNDLYDYTFRIFETQPTRYLRLTFTHDVAKHGALLDLTVFARADNSDVMASPIPYLTPTAPQLHVRWRKDVPYQDTVTSWVIRIIKGQVGIAYYDAYLKFFVSGTDTGTWSISEI